jgi:hypothetical protein
MNSAYDWLRRAKTSIAWSAALLVLAIMVSTGAAQPTEVLVYQFDPSTDNLAVDGGILDRSGHGYNGTALSLGAPSMKFVPGHVNKQTGSQGTALGMAGDDDLPGTGIWTGQSAKTLGIYQGSFTVMAWVNRTSLKADNMVFGTTGGPCGLLHMLHLGFRGADTYMGFWGNDSSAAGVPPVTVNLAQNWHHVAWRYDATKQNQSIFIDGKSANSDNNHAPYNTQFTVIIGRYIGIAGIGNCNSTSSGAFAGAIEYPRIFNVALTDAQIAAAANDQALPP